MCNSRSGLKTGNEIECTGLGSGLFELIPLTSAEPCLGLLVDQSYWTGKYASCELQSACARVIRQFMGSILWKSYENCYEVGATPA